MFNEDAEIKKIIPKKGYTLSIYCST